MSEFLAEFIGTTILIILGNGVVANVLLTKTNGHGSGWIVITTGWALAVFVGVVIATPYSGAHLNSAVTIALAIGQKFEWAKVPVFICAQLLGAMLGSFIVWLTYKPHYEQTESPELKRATFCTSPAIKHPAANLFGEIIGTFVLIFAIFYFTNAEMGDEKSPIGLGSIGAIPVAFVVWSIGLSLGGTTGYAINPARDLGPRLMHALLPIHQKGSSKWSYAWVPVIGPVIGASLAALLYLYLKV
jgi:glycerol uptake facilitator protein